MTNVRILSNKEILNERIKSFQQGARGQKEKLFAVRKSLEDAIQHVKNLVTQKIFKLSSKIDNSLKHKQKILDFKIACLRIQKEEIEKLEHTDITPPLCAAATAVLLERWHNEYQNIMGDIAGWVKAQIDHGNVAAHERHSFEKKMIDEISQELDKLLREFKHFTFTTKTNLTIELSSCTKKEKQAVAEQGDVKAKVDSSEVADQIAVLKEEAVGLDKLLAETKAASLTSQTFHNFLVKCLSLDERVEPIIKKIFNQVRLPKLSIFHCACILGDLRVARQCLQKIDDKKQATNQPTQEELPPILLVIISNYKDTELTLNFLNLLKEQGAKIPPQALHVAAIHDNCPAAEWLIQQGMKVDSTAVIDTYMGNALGCAVFYNSIDMIELLLGQKADVHYPNNLGSPSKIADRMNHPEVLSCLKRHQNRQASPAEGQVEGSNGDDALTMGDKITKITDLGEASFPNIPAMLERLEKFLNHRAAVPSLSEELLSKLLTHLVLSDATHNTTHAKHYLQILRKAGACEIYLLPNAEGKSPIQLATEYKQDTTVLQLLEVAPRRQLKDIAKISHKFPIAIPLQNKAVADLYDYYFYLSKRKKRNSHYFRRVSILNDLILSDNPRASILKSLEELRAHHKAAVGHNHADNILQGILNKFCSDSSDPSSQTLDAHVAEFRNFLRVNRYLYSFIDKLNLPQNYYPNHMLSAEASLLTPSTAESGESKHTQSPPGLSPSIVSSSPTSNSSFGSPAIASSGSAGMFSSSFSTSSSSHAPSGSLSSPSLTSFTDTAAATRSVALTLELSTLTDQRDAVIDMIKKGKGSSHSNLEKKLTDLNEAIQKFELENRVGLAAVGQLDSASFAALHAGTSSPAMYSGSAAASQLSADISSAVAATHPNNNQPSPAPSSR